jgi:hypothetical protein
MKVCNVKAALGQPLDGGFGPEKDQSGTGTICRRGAISMPLELGFSRSTPSSSMIKARSGSSQV